MSTSPSSFENYGNLHRQTPSMVAGWQHLAECGCANPVVYNDEPLAPDTQVAHS